jgi:hypothetical protein
MAVAPNPHWIKVRESPASEPNRPAWVPCRRYVSRKPGSWKNHETSVVAANMKKEPVGSSSMIISPLRSSAVGACTVVSQ